MAGSDCGARSDSSRVVIAGGYLLDYLGIEALGPMILILLILMAASTFPLPRDRAGSRQAEHFPILSIVRRPAVLALLAGFFLMQVAHGPYNAFYSIHLVEAGYSKKAVGWLWALGVVSEIVLFIWLPRLMRAFSLNQILMASFGCAFVRFLLIAWGVQSLDCHAGLRNSCTPSPSAPTIRPAWP